MSQVDKALAEEFNRLRGQLCGLIESFGLPEKQERGCIATLKTLSYDAQKRIGDLATQIVACTCDGETTGCDSPTCPSSR